MPLPPSLSARRVKRFIAVLSLALIAAALAFAFASGSRSSSRPAAPGDVGLFTSLPILWNEYGELSELLKPESDSHWAVAVLAQRGTIRPLDRIAPLPQDLGLLVMAQPRPLSPDENVALDQWVRGGGRVLLFADPMLTQHSHFPIGDRRRPEGTVLLSPILARWGVTLLFDEAQPAGLRTVDLFGQPAQVNLAGRLVPAEGTSHCRVEADGLAVLCSVGTGTVLIVADAALLEPAHDGDAGDRASTQAVALNAVLDGTLAH